MAAGVFELGFGGPQVPLSQVIREREAQVAGEQQHLFIPGRQPAQQVSGLGLFDPGSAWIVRQPAEQGAFPPIQQRVEDIGRNLDQIRLPRPVGGGVELVERIQRRLRPGVVGVGLLGGDEFPGDVRPTERLLARA